jgi:hypothetical protein
MVQVTRHGGTEAAELDTLFFRYADQKRKVLDFQVGEHPSFALGGMPNLQT